jgi:DNA-binding PadR family transcriptional regulator
MHQVAVDSDEQLILGPATLYTNLKRLLEVHLIKESEPRQEENHPHAAQRRYYSLTSAGKAALEQELARSERFNRVLRGRLV